MTTPPKGEYHQSHCLSDHIARALVSTTRFVADAFFTNRYGHRAVVLETVAAVPGMVGALFQHLNSLRRIRDDRGWIQLLLDEAENERMHLMVYVSIAQPTRLERWIILVAQIIFFTGYFIVYFLSPKVGHRIVGYLEEEAIESYAAFLAEIDSGKLANSPAPALAISYWLLPQDASLRDVIIATQKDEMRHRDTNHRLASELHHMGSNQRK